MYIGMAWGFQAGESEFVCINNAFCLYETFPLQTKISLLHILQLFFSVLLGVIADIGVLQGCFVTARNYSSVILYVAREKDRCRDSFPLGSLGPFVERRHPNHLRDGRESVAWILGRCWDC